jgi:hypothetical protein
MYVSGSRGPSRYADGRQIITPPPTLSQALAAASQSGQGGLGLGNLETALTITELSPELEKLTVKGFTIFAPIDSAWDASTQNAAEDDLKALIGKHASRWPFTSERVADVL